MKKITYLLIINLIVLFSIINVNASNNSLPLVFGNFASLWPYLLVELIIFIFLFIFFQRRCRTSKTQITDLTYEVKKSDVNYKLLFENMIVAIAVIQDSKVVMVNQEMENLTGYSKENLLNLHVKDCIFSEDLEKVLSFHKKILKTNDTDRSCNFRLNRRNKEMRYIQSEVVKINWNKKPAILSLLLDVTNQKKAESKFSATEEKFRLITENISDIIWVINLTQDKISYLSPSMKNLTGYSIDEMQKIKFKQLVNKDYYNNLMEIITRNQKLIENLDNPSSHDRYEMEIKHRNGYSTWTETEMKFYKNEQKETIIICSTRNIDSRKKDEDKINFLLNHDSLTGFINRRAFEIILKEYDNPSNYPLTIVFSDINGLKLTNDIFGHNAGDELIKKSTKVLKSFAREKDVFARIGGDEFVVLMPNTDFEKASFLISKIKEALSKENIYAIKCSLSMGFDVKTSNLQNLQTVKENAESEMYKEKAATGKTIDQEMLQSILHTFYQVVPDEKLHSEYTAKICEQIGKKLKLTGNELYILRESGRLHNIGKLPESLKGSKLDPLDKSKCYPAVSYRILTLFDETMDIADFVYQHKENWDGSGYPKGLKGNEIPLISQILGLADHYVSLISGLYGHIVTIEEATKIINSLSGINYNPEIVDAFNMLIKDIK